MMFWLLLAVFVTKMFNGIQETKPLPPRYWHQEMDKEIKDKADSLMDNWLVSEMKRDSL